MSAYVEHLPKPFFVATRFKNNIGWDTTDTYFAELNAARAAFAEECRDTTKFAYLGEIGLFSNRTLQLVSDYMTFETNDFEWWREISELNRMNQKGFGRPWSNDSYATNYISAFEAGCTTWSL